MAYLLAEREGWDTRSLKFEILTDFKGLRKGVNDSSAAFFMWEHFTTKPYWAEAHEVKHMGDIPTPWPCFMMAARKGWVDAHLDEVRALLHVVRCTCGQFKAEPAASVPEVSAHNGLALADAQSWFDTVQFAQCGALQGAVLPAVVAALHRVGVLSESEAAAGTSACLVHPLLMQLQDAPVLGTAEPSSCSAHTATLPPPAISMESPQPPPSPPGEHQRADGTPSLVHAAGGQAFHSMAEYQLWVGAKRSALAVVLGHMAAYGGVPTGAHTGAMPQQVGI
jgi:hypothetical protein